jgi:PAS domain S-box-containing protein
MRKKLLVFHFIFLLTLVGIGVTSFAGSQPFVTIVLLFTNLTMVLLSLKSWLHFIQDLLKKSDQTLHQPSQQKSAWTLGQIERLQNNQKKVEHKFTVAAELITQLANPEKVGNAEDLGGNDPIGKALQGIREEMKKIKEEDEKRAWVTQGLALFGNILRNKSEVKEYGYNIISHLIKYLKVNQGGIFIEYKNENNEPYLELIASYAYGRRKFEKNRISAGEGLLGQCMCEKDFIFLTDIPKDYAKITSGLGEATPRNVIVAPLLFNDTFCGAIELASFEILQPHHLEFLKKVCEDIASEIVSLKNVEHTKQLLEESNTLTRELQSREEEMKQNLEELAATQEEMSRKQTELSGIIYAIDSTLATAELDTHGNIIKHNAILEQFLGYSSAQLLQKNYASITGDTEDISWHQILNGEIKSGDFQTFSFTGTEVWLSITFTPITDTNGNMNKLLCMIQNITQKKMKEKEFERLSVVADNTDNSVIITDAKGLIEYVNEGFTKITGYDAKEVIGKNPGKILQGPLTDPATILKLREQIKSGVPIYEEILNYNKKGETYWVSLAINPVKDEHGSIEKFISIQADITQTKIKALDFHQKMEALGRSNAIIEIDIHGTILAANKNYLQVLGYVPEEMIGKPYSILTHKEDTFKKLMTTIGESGVQDGVFSRFDKSGKVHCMKLMDYPVLNLNGEIEKIIEFGVDVSNERRLEKEAARRQIELKSYLNGINNTIATAEFAPDGKFKDANDIFLKVMGYTKDDLSSHDYESMMGDDQTVRMMWENLNLGKSFAGEFKMKDTAGKELWLIGTFNPITIDGTSPEKIIMFAQFTTQEKEKLNELHAMVNALKSTLPVLEFNADFICKTVNEKGLKIFGLSRMALRSKTILDFLAPYYHPIWAKNKNEIANTDFSNFLLPFISNGNIINYEVSVSVNRNLDGSIGKVIVLLVKEVQDPIPVLIAM